jgi:formate hydrogenlyase transcriptional activator
MSTAAPTSIGTEPQRYGVVLRISEALSACREPEELARMLADQLGPFLPFDFLDVLVVKQNLQEIEWHAWGKGRPPMPDLPLGDPAGWPVINTQEPLHIADWDRDLRFPHLKQAFATLGISLGSVLRFPLTTPHRRLGTFGIASTSVINYTAEDIGFLHLIARVVAFALDDGLNLRRAQAQNDRLQLLLNLTNQITSNLELREVLRAISANIRELMQCDAVAISWPDVEGNLVVHALEAPQIKGFLKEGWVVSPAVAKPAIRVLDTLTPFIVNAGDPDSFGREASESALADGLRSHVFLPLVNRGRAVGVLGIARKTDTSFTADDVEFLTQVTGQIAIAIENALAYKEISELKDKLAQEKLYLEEEIRSEMNFENIVGNSPVLKRVLELVETVAPNDSTVLLLGETGTGKELIARAIHDRSRRRDRTFVKLNCAAIPTGLLESELFGHEKGAFTGAITQKIGRMELADQGTLFLDEVGDIPIEIQPKLLRALQEREFERLGGIHTRKVNVRLVAATNRDLGKMIADREFRSDLYYRLNVFPIRIPPLRERKQDIPLLVSYFVQKFAKQMQKKIEAIPAAAMKRLSAWEWPGNIRELENFLERAVILTRGKSLEAPLAELHKLNTDESAHARTPQGQEDIARIVKETIDALDGKKNVVADDYAKLQREQIVRALTESKGRVGGAEGAAARMGVNRTTLLARIKKFGIDPRQYA